MKKLFDIHYIVEKNKKTLRLALSWLLALPALFAMFAPAVYSYQWLVRLSVQVMWCYFALAIILLIFSKKYWMFLSFSCCAALCLFLKQTSNDSFAFAEKTDGVSVKFANFNMSASEDSLEEMVKTLADNTVDILSVQEVTPDVDSILRKNLKAKYPYIFSVKRVDYYGMMVFSKYAFGAIDTFQYRGIPNIIACVNIGKDSCRLHFISSYCLPAFNSTGYEVLKKQLSSIATKANNINAATVVLGTYNTVPWAPEIQDFKKIGNLDDSRLGFSPTYPNNAPTLLKVPYDHIFYSRHLKCTNFQTISNASSMHMGIEGTFQFVVPQNKNSSDETISTQKNQ